MGQAELSGSSVSKSKGYGRLLYLLLALSALGVLAATLATASSSSPANRVRELELSVRCPTCGTLSVAVADDPVSHAMKEEIESLAAKGMSNTQILDYLKARYGNSILLSPPGSSLSWSLIGLLAALSALAGSVGAVALKKGKVKLKLPRLRSKYLAALGAALVLIGVAYLGAALAGVNLPGVRQSYSVSDLRAEAVLARTLAGQGYENQALALDQEILKKDPDIEIALADAGYLLGRKGISQARPLEIRHGISMLNKALKLSPSDPVALLYLGDLYEAGLNEPKLAAAVYQRLLSLHPPGELLKEARPEIEEAFKQAGLPGPNLP